MENCWIFSSPIAPRGLRRSRKFSNIKRNLANSSRRRKDVPKGVCALSYTMSCGMTSLHQSESRTLEKRIIAKITFLSPGVSLEVVFAWVSKRRTQSYTPLPIAHAQLTLFTMMLHLLKSHLANVRIPTHPFRVLNPCNSK